MTARVLTVTGFSENAVTARVLLKQLVAGSAAWPCVGPHSGGHRRHTQALPFSFLVVSPLGHATALDYARDEPKALRLLSSADRGPAQGEQGESGAQVRARASQGRHRDWRDCPQVSGL